MLSTDQKIKILGIIIPANDRSGSEKDLETFKKAMDLVQHYEPKSENKKE